MSEPIEPRVAQLNIGELLSNKRHQARQSIADVAAKLKLSQSVIEKLEVNEFNEIGTPVYVRGYLGLYAKHLGLNGASIIEHYNQQFPAEELAIRPSAGQGLSEARQKSKRHSKTLSLLMVAMVLGGLAFAYMQAETYWQQKTAEEVILAGNETETKGGNEVASALNEAKQAQNLANDVLSGDAIATGGSLVTDVELDIALSDAAKQAEKELIKEQQAEALAQKEQVVIPKDTLETTEVNSPDGLPKIDVQLESIDDEQSTAPKNVDSVDVVTSAQTSNTESESVAKALPEGTAKISFTFKGECWVKITDANKKVIVAKLYKAGDSLETSGVPPLTISTGAPFAVESVEFNDVAVNLADYKTRGLRYRFPKQ